MFSFSNQHAPLSISSVKNFCKCLIQFTFFFCMLNGRKMVLIQHVFNLWCSASCAEFHHHFLWHLKIYVNYVSMYFRESSGFMAVKLLMSARLICRVSWQGSIRSRVWVDCFGNYTFRSSETTLFSDDILLQMRFRCIEWILQLGGFLWMKIFDYWNKGSPFCKSCCCSVMLIFWSIPLCHM